MPHPLLESDSCECSHKGKVIFPSSHQNFLLVTEAGILTPSDLSKAKIIGCTNPIIKGGPCSKLVKIPDSITTNLLEVENEKAVLAECISQVLTDKGSPIILQGEPKAKGILEIEQDSKQKTKQNIQDSNSFYPYHSSYPHLASNDKNAGVEESEKEEEGKIQRIIITNKKGEFLFTIEKQNIKENILDVKTLYDNYGSQWFESSAEKYHKLLEVNPDLKDKEKCKKLGLLYFAWKDVVEFAEAIYKPSKTIYDLMTNFSKYFNRGSGDWKQSPNGASSYLLVSMEGIPYWADAVGQIPYVINAYKTFYELTENHMDAKNATINIGYAFKKGEYKEMPKFVWQYCNYNGIDPKLYKENTNKKRTFLLHFPAFWLMYIEIILLYCIRNKF